MSVIPDENVFLEITETSQILGVESDDGTYVELVVEDVTSVVALEIAEFLEFDDGRGPAGPRGPAGGELYEHIQSSPAAAWTIPHNLNTRPTVVFVLDSDPTEPVTTDYWFVDLNNVLVEWPSPESGRAYLK